MRRRHSPDAVPVTWLEGSGKALNVCHPDWRGIRTATSTFRAPMVMTIDLAASGPALLAEVENRGLDTVVVQGFPPGAAGFLVAAGRAGIRTRVVLHSSLTQLGAEPGEREMTDTVIGLVRDGTIGRLGFVKEGLAEAYTAMGVPAHYVPNRIPGMPTVTPIEFEGVNVGVFAEPFWRKNLPNQLAATALLDATAHTMSRPAGSALDGVRLVEHGELPWVEFQSLQASMDLNLYVTLSECHPLTPIESYLLGVPCLMSQTSAVFRSDPALWALTTVGELDNPRAIADAARDLLDGREDAVSSARAWMGRFDEVAARLWETFVS